MDTIIKEGVEGFIKPLYDFIISLVIYALSEFYYIAQETTSNMAHTSNFSLTIVNLSFFIVIFVLISLITEIMFALRQGFYEPIYAFSKVGGIILGIIVFWDVIAQMCSIIDLSIMQMLLSSIIICASSIGGVYLRYLFTKNRRNCDEYEYYS